jgi:hypothetical protein
VVIMAIDSKGVTEPPVSVASTGVKVLRFDINLIIGLHPANITNLGHPEVRRRSTMAGDAE